MRKFPEYTISVCTIPYVIYRMFRRYLYEENYDYSSRHGGWWWSQSAPKFRPGPMSVSVLTIFALPNIFLAPRSPGPSTATFSFPGGGTFIKTPVNSAVRRSREAPTTGRGLRFIQCYSTAQSPSTGRGQHGKRFRHCMELIPVSGMFLLEEGWRRNLRDRGTFGDVWRSIDALKEGGGL